MYKSIQCVKEDLADQSLNTEATRKLTEELQLERFKSIDTIASQQIDRESSIIWARIQLSK